MIKIFEEAFRPCHILFNPKVKRPIHANHSLSECNVHQSRSKISKIRRTPKKCANQYGRPSRSLNSKRKHTQGKKGPHPDHKEGRKAVKEDIQKQKRANTPVLCHQNRKIPRMSQKRDEEEGAIFV